VGRRRNLASITKTGHLVPALKSAACRTTGGTMPQPSANDSVYSAAPWTRHYTGDTAVKVAHGNLAELAREAARQWPERIAFTTVVRNGMSGSLKYAEVDAMSDAFAVYLREALGLSAGARVALQMPNCLAYPVAALGVFKAGCVLVNTNPLYTTYEIKHQLADSGAKALMVLANIAKNASEVIGETQVEKVIVTELADLHPPLKRTLINFVVKHVKKMVPSFRFDNQISMREALALGDQPWKPVPRTPEDVVVLQYTGGTTGVAKGAMLTNRNLVANMLQLNLHMKEVFRPNVETYIAPLPLYHIYAFTIHCMSGMSLGNHNVLIPNPRDIPAFVKTLQGVEFTCFVGLNTLFNALCRNPDFVKLDFSSLRLTSSGGMALTEDTARRWKEVTGVDIVEGYGLTETSPVVTINPPDAPRVGSVGVPLPDTECKVIDEAGNTLPNDEAGELCIRGPQVMKGYWQRPDATAEVMDSEGWFKSGDIAVIQDDGYIRIVDRKKDMINVSGFKVFPSQVEAVLYRHDGVKEALVIAVPDRQSGERPKAFVSLNEGADVTAAQLIEYLHSHVGKHERVVGLEIRDSLPKTMVGKLSRKELIAEEKAKAGAA
jgi:long-chain acyl-CoA synthetase